MKIKKLGIYFIVSLLVLCCVLESAKISAYAAHPTLTEKKSIGDMEIGDVIRAHYKASSGEAGAFSNFGQNTSELIPAASSATPDGDFYWVYMGNDTQGRKVLVADRNIQKDISWDTLNKAEFIDGKSIKVSIPIDENEGTAIASSVTENYASYIISPQNGFVVDHLKNNKNYVWIGKEPLKSDETWLGKDYGKDIAVKGFKLKNYSNSADGTDKVSIDYSSDGTNWTSIGTFDVKYGENDVISFNEDGSVKARYWRISSNPSLGGSGEGIWLIYYLIFYQEANLSVRSLSGGTSMDDGESEWNKYIVDSNLGGKITSGDNNIWNWNGVSSWTSTDNGSGQKVIRGNDVANGFSNLNITDNGGFRPVLLVGGSSSSSLTLDIEASKYEIPGGTEFETFAVIKKADSIYAEDINIKYDKTLFELVSAETVNSSELKIYHEKTSTEGEARYVVASKGSANGLDGDEQILKIKFRAKNVDGSGDIEVASGLVADGQGNEITPSFGGKTFKITKQNLGDVNKDGKFTLGDLAIAGRLFESNSSDWGSFEPDVDANGDVEDIDLSSIVQSILANE